jgi:hypothetical protein
MKRLVVRAIGGGLFAASSLTLVLVLTMAQEPVGASACCQVCDANEAACYNSCALLPEGEPRDTCQAECFHQLYQVPWACFLHCNPCGPSSPASTICYTCTTTYWYENGLCAVNVECSVGSSGQAQQGSACISY